MNVRKLLTLLAALAVALILVVALISLLPALLQAVQPAGVDRTGAVASVLAITPITIPKRLAIYYGWPSSVNAANGNIAQATAVFTQFDLIVFGHGLQHGPGDPYISLDPALHIPHPDYTNTVAIIHNLLDAGKEVYGYIDLGVSSTNHSLTTIADLVNEWAATGVTGIFYDLGGKDWGVSRARLISAVDLAHNHSPSLTVFANIWDPDDAFGPDPEGPPPLRDGDWYLAESHPVSNDEHDSFDLWWVKSQKIMAYRNQANGVRMAAVGTGNAGPTSTITDSTYWVDHPPFRQTLWATYLFGFDAFGFTDIIYSAHCSCLRPLPDIPTDIGEVFIGPPISPSAATGALTYTRFTDKGVIYVFGDAGDPAVCDGAFLNLPFRAFVPLVHTP